MIPPCHLFSLREAFVDNQYLSQEVIKIREGTPGERITILERSKEPLLMKKRALEGKIEELQARQKGKPEVSPEEKALRTGR